MTTVVDTNSIVTAVSKVCLIPYAVHIIQEDRSSPRAKNAIVVCISNRYSICKECNRNK